MALERRSDSGEAPADGSEPSVRLDGVSKRFGDLVAVRELELDIGRGEFFTLLGPSGCGKTTTLRMVAGFEEPTAGRVLIDGQDVAGLPSYKRPTNTVFQSYALFPHLSVGENVAFGLRRKKVPKHEVTATCRPRSSSGWGSLRRSTGGRASSPAASSSGSRWPGPSSTCPRCCSSTSPSERST